MQKTVVKEMEAVDAKTYDVEGHNLRFNFYLIPADQKWHATMGGELSNSATFFSTYANVSTANVETIGGSIGDRECTWQPWSYQSRITVASQVDAFKLKYKITDSSGDRTKVTKFIAKAMSRQELKPYLGKYISLAMPDPLHCTNNAWQLWHSHVLNIALSLVKAECAKAASSARSLQKLPSNSVFVLYLESLENVVKCGRLLTNIKEWVLRERGEL